ncbi:hypothetical protein K435DRAFT_357628 [Dendrothele bispora CBS 962.96]|uniref:DEAD/DEAH box helicase domain-containing protein n=1 Tax=Dendrothele bispora (strain CBS 962.96) TaxID=1314807 RepID=A0A4S8LD93_DENBC|nr:hypothetical protein K435DRAFT_357628 [Dendrothele bispora CBS 962.96]
MPNDLKNVFQYFKTLLHLVFYPSRRENIAWSQPYLIFPVFSYPQMPPKTSIYTPNTPRHRKVPKSPSKTTQGIRIRLPDRLKDAKSIKETLKSELKLSFEPDDWQAHFVHRILQRYDGMRVAATGLGKSLLFEGTAKLVGKGEMVFVICPLKSLERDQVLKRAGSSRYQ